MIFWAPLPPKPPMTAQSLAGLCAHHAAHARASSGISLGCPSLRLEATSGGRGWVLKSGFRRADPRRGLLLAAQRHPEGMGVRGSTARNAPRGSMVCLGKQVPLLSGTQGAGLSLQLTSPPANASVGPGRGFHQNKFVPVCWNFLFLYIAIGNSHTP